MGWDVRVAPHPPSRRPSHSKAPRAHPAHPSAAGRCPRCHDPHTHGVHARRHRHRARRTHVARRALPAPRELPTRGHRALATAHAESRTHARTRTHAAAHPQAYITNLKATGSANNGEIIGLDGTAWTAGLGVTAAEGAAIGDPPSLPRALRRTARTGRGTRATTAVPWECSMPRRSGSMPRRDEGWSLSCTALGPVAAEPSLRPASSSQRTPRFK